MSDPRFIHLRLHTEYSLLEGAMRVKKLFDGGSDPKTGEKRSGLVAAAGMPAVAVTDTNNMFCALEFSETAAKAGVQPILGCQVDVDHAPVRPGEQPNPYAALILLVQNETGWRNLLKLNSHLYLRNDGTLPHVTLEELAQHGEGLICLTGGPGGPVGRHLQNGNRARAQALLEQLAGIYPDRLYVELQRHPGEGGAPEIERLTERGHVEMAYEMGLPLVATNDVYFPKPDMYEAHDAMICIAEGAYVDQSEPRRRLTPQHYFKTPEEMAALFRRPARGVGKHRGDRAALRIPGADPRPDPAALRRERGGGVAAPGARGPGRASRGHPARGIGGGVREAAGFRARHHRGDGLSRLLPDRRRLHQMGQGQRHPGGPGRGSGAGSLVAYSLTITDLDPLRYSLLFERFLNPERVSMPDFDIDFCMDRREEVIRYVQEKYGRDRVGQIITFGALLSKAAVRDVGRVLQMPFGQVDKLSKMIPVEGVKPVSIEKAIAQEERLRAEMIETEQDKREGRENPVKRLMDYAGKIEGLLRNASTHAAGVVIGDRPLDELVPLYRDPRSDMPATQFNMKWVEPAGLVKFDFLGLKTLTVIQNAIDLITGRGGSCTRPRTAR
jgi:DNA polymerase-3 subunit alpha